MAIILKKLEMEFEKLKIDGLVLCKPKIIEDERGFFSENFRKEFGNHMLNTPFVN